MGRGTVRLLAPHDDLKWSTAASAGPTENPNGGSPCLEQTIAGQSLRARQAVQSALSEFDSAEEPHAALAGLQAGVLRLLAEEVDHQAQALGTLALAFAGLA